MKHICLTALLALPLLWPSMAAADCYVSYKAKKQPPLELHFGILSLSGSCPSGNSAAETTAARIAADGWQLLNVVATKETPPSAAEQANAGAFYLRY